jgi:hypothetical protein
MRLILLIVNNKAAIVIFLLTRQPLCRLQEKLIHDEFAVKLEQELKGSKPI